MIAPKKEKKKEENLPTKDYKNMYRGGRKRPSTVPEERKRMKDSTSKHSI